MELEDHTLLKQQVKDLLTEATKKAFAQIKNPEVKIEYPASEEHGDYAANIAMRLAKELGMPPREVAQKILDKLPKNELIAKTEIAGPGFINFFLTEKILNDEISEILKQGDEYGASKAGKDQNLIVEYSQPNIAKPLGAHHLCSTIIGQGLYNIFKKLGFNAISINHIGDWGTQFGKLIVAYKKWGNREQIEKDPINEMLKLYVKFHEEAEKDPALDDQARHEFKIFEEGDKENHEIWQWFVDESMKDVQKTYDKLGGIHFDYTQGESFYEDKMGSIIEEGKKKGVFEVGEKGAYVAHFEDENIPTVPIQKKDGATLYITRDFAALKYRIDTWDPAKILYVVDAAQILHFKQIFGVADRLGWYEEQGVHVWHGRMSMKDRSMSTRKGNVILLNDVLDEAIKRAAKIIEEKNPELKDKDEVSNRVGTGAVKYNILSQNRTSDITFDWDNMLSFDGNSSPYLQYTYARARSILRRSSESTDGSIQDPEDTAQKTRSLLGILPKFPEAIANAAREYKPNILANYIYELAQRFNAFYNTVPVLKAENTDAKQKRLQIVEAAAQIIKNGLALLTVDVVEEM